MNKSTAKLYSFWFFAPAGVIYILFFILPTFASFFFSFTIWTLRDWAFTGLDNFKIFLTEPSLSIGFRNTVVYAFATCALKVIFGFLLAVLLCEQLKSKGFLRTIIFYPTILSTIAVGIMFKSIMHPTLGVINNILSVFRIHGPDWLGDPKIALFSVILVDFWKGVGIAMVIFIAGVQAIPRHYYEAAMIDGSSSFRQLVNITLPLSRSSINTVTLLALIGGIRTFDLIWVMTQGGPGFTTDLISSIIYKQYQSGFYGISTAGNVILFILIIIIAVPTYMAMIKKEVDL